MMLPHAMCREVYDVETGIEYPARWRVFVYDEFSDDGSSRTIDDLPDEGFYFGSRVDAELAVAALIAAGYDTSEKIVDAGWETIKRTMCGALRW
jgi:hypothetical protein